MGLPLRVRSLAAAAAGITLLATTTPAQAPTAEEVLARAAEYTARFVNTFSNLVATERYVQEVRPADAALPLRWKPVPESHRELRSDFLLLNVGGPLEWRPYRDVYLVDGKPVTSWWDDRVETVAGALVWHFEPVCS